MMSFHRGGYYAVNFGLDSDNVMRIGGWSASANRWELDMSGNNWVASSFRAPIFYDSNNTGYYVDPASGSNLNGDVTSSQFYVNGWFRNNSNNTGLYNQNTTQHWSSTTNGYWDASSTTTISSIRFYTGGHLTSLRGYVYADTSNNIGFLGAGGSWRLRVVGDDYSLADGSSMRAQLYYDSNNTGYYADLNGTTYCYYLQSATSVRADSDGRIKDNIETITDALNKVKKLRGTTFTRKDLQDKNKKHIGLIAQEVLEVIPEVVGGSEDTTYSVGYGEIVAVLIEAIKEQQEQIEEMGNLINGK
jgi:hypothetical protein